MLISFILCMLAGVGATNLLVNSSLFFELREFLGRYAIIDSLINCMTCSGFWVGIVIGAIAGFNPLLTGPAISMLSYIFDIVTEYIAISTSEKLANIELMQLKYVKYEEVEDENSEE